jgi:hypothetical protein
VIDPTWTEQRHGEVESPPQPASANILSEHETEALDGMPAQAQSELLLERSVNHYRGANQQIARRVDGWRGQLMIDRYPSTDVAAQQAHAIEGGHDRFPFSTSGSAISFEMK